MICFHCFYHNVSLFSQSVDLVKSPEAGFRLKERDGTRQDRTCSEDKACERWTPDPPFFTPGYSSAVRALPLTVFPLPRVTLYWFTKQPQQCPKTSLHTCVRSQAAEAKKWAFVTLLCFHLLFQYFDEQCENCRTTALSFLYLLSPFKTCWLMLVQWYGNVVGKKCHKLYSGQDNIPAYIPECCLLR